MEKRIKSGIAILWENLTNNQQQIRTQETKQQSEGFPLQKSDKDSYNSYGYTPEQISEILRNLKIQEVKKLTTDQILQQHPYAMDYSRGLTRNEIAGVIRANELTALETEPLLRKQQEPTLTLNARREKKRYTFCGKKNRSNAIKTRNAREYKWKRKRKNNEYSP